MLRDEMELYTKLTGEDATHVPIIKIGAYLDGYEKGLSVLEDIKAEIDKLDFDFGDFYDHTRTIHNMIDEVWDKHMKSEDSK